MKKTITTFRVLLATGLLLGLFSAEKALASHAQGSDITYVNVGPNMYVVNYKLYQDCSGIDPGTSQTLTYRAPGCNATNRTISLTRSTNPIPGNPYCSSFPAPPCNGTASTFPNFQEHKYSATITLPSLCTNWILSARIGNRPNSRNLANGSGAWLFSEALINNVATQTNSSPSFKEMPVPFVCVDRVNTFLQNVIDADGDSVIYTLSSALNDLGQPVVYGNYTGSGTGTNPYPAGVSPAGTPYPSGNFSATNPIISRNPLQVDSFTGRLVFEPVDLKGPTFPTHQGLDKYVVAIQIDEYRKINGAPVKIGHVRRDMLIIVMDCGQNQFPELDSALVRSLNYGPGAIIETGPGALFEMRFTPTDANPQDIVRMTSDAPSVLPGATFIPGSGARPTGLVSWTPTAADIRPQPYFINVTVRDNACPLEGSNTMTVGIRVTATGPTGIVKSLAPVQFSVFPNPTRSSEVTFKIKAEKAAINAEVVIYNVTGEVIDRIPVPAGAEEVQWHKNTGLPAGIYFGRYISGEGSKTIKLMHLK